MCTTAVARASTQIATWRVPNRVVLRGRVIVVTSSGRTGSCRRGRPPGVPSVIGSWAHSRLPARPDGRGGSFTGGQGAVEDLAVDAAVAPAGILPGHPQHQGP